MAYHRDMLSRRYGSFTGGIDLPDEKDATLEAPITACPPPPRLRVPLAPCGGAGAEAVVEPGRRVRAGERIGRARDDSAVDIFAPLDGRVAGTEWAQVAVRRRFEGHPAVVLEDLSDPAGAAFFQRPEEAEADGGWQSAGAEALLERIAEGSLTTYRRPPRPLAPLLRRARRGACRAVIANAMEQEPYVTADHRLLAERGAEVLEGLAILRKAVGAAEAVLAADRRRVEAYGAFIGAAERFGVSPVALPHKYPMGADSILVKVLTRRETPPGRGPVDVGSLVVGVATCYAVQQWVCRGVRPAGRVVTVSGQAVAEPANLWVPFGADCLHLPAGRGRASLVDGAEALVVHGGPMTGLRCVPGAVVTPATSGVLALSVGPAPLPSTCIRCGWCTDHCPARLNVTALNDAFELSLLAAAARGGALACVECGVCSYVCPARLPLSQRVRRLKEALYALEAAAPSAAEGGR